MTRPHAAETREPATDDGRTDGSERGSAREDDPAASPGERDRPEATDREAAATAGSRGLDRRDYLGLLGGAGAAGLLGATAAPAAGQTGLDEAGADERIRENQQGTLEVEVVDGDGNAVSGASVEVEMTEHDFDWGNMVNVDNLLNRFSEGSDYHQHLQELFNTAVLENAHKWSIWTGNQQSADDAVDWLDRNGFRIRGHTCVYGVDYAIPSDVLSAAQNGDGQTVRQRTMGHLRNIITHYGDTIQEWDVVNEAIHRGKLQQGVYPGVNPDDPSNSERPPWTTPLLADWYREAESVIDENGLDVEIATNDYNTLRWARDQYEEQVQFLADEGIDLDAMGHQAHLDSPTNEAGETWTYSTIDAVFERFAHLPVTQRITEYDMAGEEWSGQQQRAEVFRAFLKTVYGHPDVDQFVMWGMWDETHWRDEAPFFEADWSEKPALDVWRNLVLDEWWTSESGTTGGDGTVAVDAFLGEHEIVVDGSVVGTVSVTDPDGTTTVQVDGSGVSDPTDGPGPVGGGDPARDPDDDDLYEDVNGNGRQDIADAVDLFQHRADVDPEYFDFTGDGDTSIGDAVQLFRENTQ